MDGSFDAECPALLKLRKWAPFNVPLILSEFREAFISPSRQLLLLLSCQYEALILPITEGVSKYEDKFECCQSVQDAVGLPICSRAELPSDSLGDKPCVSGSSVDCDYDSPSRGSSTRYKSHPYIYGVKSLSWGVCGDAYNQHEGMPFREFLFVSGDHGIKVHAFREFNGSSDNSELILDDESGQGRWVEWGPGDVTAMENVVCETSVGVSGENADDACSRKDAHKTWLRSFMTEVETVKFDGNLCTKFPEISSFPCGADVVSFSLLDDILPFLEFFSHDSALDTDGGIKAMSDSSAASSSGLYRCSHIFSSNSHHLIGFHLTLVDCDSENSVDECGLEKNKNLVVVSRLFISGIRWVSFVKLQDSMTEDPAINWVDFCFSENLITCLSSSGVIFLYLVTSGEYVSQVDIMKACGLYSHINSYEQDQLPASAIIQKTEKVDDKSAYASCRIANKRLFSRLIAAPYTSLLAAIDNNGVVYVFSASGFVPTEYYSSEKNFPNFQHSGLGKMVAWMVGGSKIGQQKAYSDVSGSFHPKSEHVQDGQVSLLDENEFDNFWYIQQDLHVVRPLYDNYNGSFVASKRGQWIHGSKLRTKFMRRFFLPTERFTEYDCVCFSPFGLTRLYRKNKDPKESQISHTNLHADSTFYDDRCLDFGYRTSHKEKKEVFVGEAVGCTFEGCFYLVTQSGLSVFLPSVSVSSDFLPVESIGCRKLCTYKEFGCLVGSSFQRKEVIVPISPWKVEILDRVILFDGPEAADNLCLKNGWDLKISRIRGLLMAIDCLKFDEIQQSLARLVDVNLAEEGILRLIFAVVYIIFCKIGNDYEVSAASRLLSLATSFATETIRKYGLLRNKEEKNMSQGFTAFQILTSPHPASSKNVLCRKLREMANFLEIIRHLQLRLGSKIEMSGQGLEDDEKAVVLVKENLMPDASRLLASTEPVRFETVEQEELNKSEKLAMVSMDSLVSEGTTVEDKYKESSLVLQEGVLGRNALLVEKPKEMIARWKIENLDLKSVVKDALLSGRLPLAVLQLHLYRSNLVADNDSQDNFTEIREVGIAIAYELFQKGETGLAVAMLQRLGENLEASLKQLLFGTLERSLRLQLADELNIHGYLGPFEWKTLENLSLIERLYPSCRFWKTFVGRKKEVIRINLSSHPFGNLIIECGEVNGAVLGPWANLNGTSSMYDGDDENAQTGYWVAAAVWTDAWDQRTVDRIILDQPHFMGINVPWEAQLEYHICHNNHEEVLQLLNQIPTFAICSGTLQISLDYLQTVSSAGRNTGYNGNSKYICSPEELDSVCMDIPEIKVFRSSASNMSCMWLRTYMEKELMKKFIFLKEFWEGTEEIVSLLACSGIVTRTHVPCNDESCNSLGDMHSSDEGAAYWDVTMQALHKLVVYHCVLYNLPNLLDLYLDHHNLAIDEDSLCSLLEAAGDCEWARWMLLSRIRGHEYDASFSNARSIMSKHSVTDSRMSVRNIGEMICTVDDVAEVGSELAAIATLMYSHVPIQNCLSSGSVNRHGKSSAQCTLENLRHALQQFPTLWRTLVAACFGQDITSRFSGPKATTAFGGSELSEYLNWRNNIFYSSGHDTSLLQMLPYWFPKAIRRLVQLFVQGPLGWHSLSGLSFGETLFDRDIEFYLNSDEHSEISAVTWEATIQKHVEEELYDSSLVEHQLGLEHHLHRGRALAAFNQLIGARIQKLKSERLSVDSMQGQTNVQSDVQTILAPITQSEKSLLSSVVPLAIMHYENSMLVASCVFLLELCGLSASILRVDVAALRRISIFYKSIEDDENRQQTPKCSVLHTISPRGSIAESLAQALADEHMHQYNASMSKKESQSLIAGKCPSRVLLLVLQHLEKASLPHMSNGNTCGYWLLTGDGDGNELRSQQKAASQHWNLVTLFCQMHQLPLSTKYLDLLARDNDWVGFLSEAQIGGYPFATVLQVATKQFSDPRLRVHLTTVLKGTQSRNKSCSSSYLENYGTRNATAFSDEKLHIPVELFEILAGCEKQKYPGKALLVKAKELSWSLLAVIASCFADVTPLSCLAVWLEITAARETSSIKVNDIASQIASSVEMAVAATNSLPAGSRSLTCHYNRQNPKRRRLMEPMLTEPVSKNSDITSASAGVSTFLTQIVQEEKKAQVGELVDVPCSSHEGPDYLSKMVAVLCEQHLFLPLLRAFEMFLPSCSLLPFVRALQAFSQMRLSEASAHLGSFSARIKEEPIHLQTGVEKGHIGALWISFTAVKCADSMLSTCPSPYEKRCLLQLLAAIDFADGGFASAYYRRLYWKINLAEPLLRKDDDLNLGNEALDDVSLLNALENNGHWEQARNWAKQLEASGGMWKNVVHRVTETQAESMVAEWKEFLWDVPEERVALWGHCQTLFIRYSFPHLQAGLFFLKHAETAKDLPAKELHELLLLALQWLSGMITLSNPVYPLNLLREIETRAWLLAVKAEAQVKSEGDLTSADSTHCSSVIDKTASIISKMDNHINAMRNKLVDKHDAREYIKEQGSDAKFSMARRKAKVAVLSRKSQLETVDKDIDAENDLNPRTAKNDLQLQDDNLKVGLSFSKWEERVGPVEMERAVLSLLEFGQVAAAKQLQQKLSPEYVPSEFILVDVTLKLAEMSTPESKVHLSTLDEEVQSVIQKHTSPSPQDTFDPLEVLEILVTAFSEASGRGLCKRIIAIVKAANTLGLSFSEAFEKKPVEILQLLSLKAQESFAEAKLLVQTHSMSATSIARILAESFLKGLLAAHRGGYMELQKEEGPSPLLWRFSDFLKWAELCPSEPEIGHALMRLVITGQEIPHACEVELLILSHHFYKSSACLDGVDVLVALATNRVEAYVSEGDFSCLARLLTGVGNFQALNFILGILIENGQLEILLQKYSAAAEEDAKTAEAVKGFRMSVLTSLKHFNPNDLGAIAMVYNHFDMKHEAAALLESRAEQSSRQWFRSNDKDQNEDLLDSMRFFIEAAEVHSSLDAGNMTRKACAQASLVSLQIRMPDIQWLHLSDTNARRILVEQSRFQEALIVAEAYGLNQPSEWALVLWNQMLKPELTEEFVAEFVAVLPLQPSMLVELAKFYRAEVVARGDQSQFSVWLTGGGMPAEWVRNLGRSFRCLLRRTRDLRLRLELARVATGFTDVVDACLKALDKVPENAGPLVLRKGHGGAYLPLM